MKWMIVGLGNSGEQYAQTRHNAGRLALEVFRQGYDFSDWSFVKAHNALLSKGEIDGKTVSLLEPETYMNESGKSLSKLVKSRRQSAQLVVVHDDIDLPLGTWKFSWNRGSGGHKGVESIARTLKTKEFIRVRIGILPCSPSGEAFKPIGKEGVTKFVLGKFTEEEDIVLKRVCKEVSSGIALFIKDGLEKAMNVYHLESTHSRKF